VGHDEVRHGLDRVAVEHRDGVVTPLEKVQRPRCNPFPI
jgi:hypothetical protein